MEDVRESSTVEVTLVPWWEQMEKGVTIWKGEKGCRHARNSPLPGVLLRLAYVSALQLLAQLLSHAKNQLLVYLAFGCFRGKEIGIKPLKWCRINLSIMESMFAIFEV